MEYVLETDGLMKRYGHFQVLNGLTMKVPESSIYGFIGRNGAGKTTLIRLVCGLQPDDAGSFSIYGIDSRDKRISKARRRMGAIVEKPALYQDMTAADNLKQQCLTLGIPTYGEIPELLELVGLSDAGKKKVWQFSLGMKQRLGIAVALIGDPDFLVLDEPTNGLDPQGIIEMRELILKLNRQRRMTVLISSHILDELSRIATHYGFIDRGRLIREVSARELDGIFRRCLFVKVNNTEKMAPVLDGAGMEYEIFSSTEAKIYGVENLSRLVFLLAERDCEVITAQEQNESLESYFINLMGGGKNE